MSITPEPRPESKDTKDIQVIYSPFPVECIPEPGQTFIKAVAEAVGVDTSIPAVAYLAICAGLIGACRKIRIKKGWDEPCVLWVAIVGRPSSGKSPAINNIIEPLEALETELYKQGRRAIISDITVEALCQRLAENPQGLLLYRDELAGWISSFNQYNKNGGDEAAYLSIWSGKSVRVDRKTSNQYWYVENPNLSILGGIQLRILLRKLKGEHLDNGLAQRFLYAYPEWQQRRWTDSTIEDDVISDVGAVYKKIIGMVDGGQVKSQFVGLSKEAVGLFKAFYDTLTDENESDDGVVSEALDKLPAYLARIALVLHELKNVQYEQLGQSISNVITPETMCEAVRITNWFKRQALRMFSRFELLKSEKSGGLQHIKREEIEAWLRDRVKEEPVLSSVLEAEAKEKGFTWSYVQLIAREQGIQKIPSPEHGGKYIWKR